MKKPKIVHVTFDMRIGGTEQVICNLVENTDRSRFQLSILCIEKEIGPFGKELIKKGFSITSLSRNPGFDITLIIMIYNYIKENKIDILHCHQYTPYVYGVLGALTTKCKVIFTEHGRFFPDQRKFKRILINPLLNLVTNRVTAISKATLGALVNFENFPGHKIRVIYNGMNSDRFFKNDTGEKLIPELDENSFVLGTVARLDPIKNQKIMIKALKRVHQKYDNIYLIIVGDGPERKNLEDLVQELELSSFVIFTGFRQDTHLLYKIMDVFLLTSFSEGTAMTLLEAMASGLPCIATDAGGNPEIVKHNETGIIIPSDNITSLAESIIRLMEDKDFKTKAGLAGIERFKKKFTIDHMIKAYEKLYGEMLNGF